MCVRVASTTIVLPTLNSPNYGPSWWFLSCHGRQKDKERTSRLSLFLAKSGSHENVSPHKTTNSTANK